MTEAYDPEHDPKHDLEPAEQICESCNVPRQMVLMRITKDPDFRI